MARWLRLVAVVVPFVLVSCGAEDDEGAATISESTEAPFGLDTVDLPDTDSGLLALFDEMPEEIEGVARIAEDDALAAQYGRLNGLFAALQSETGASGVTVVESMSSFEDESGGQVENSQLDPAADLVWLFGSFTDDGGAGLVHVAMWGEPDGGWLFAVNASTPEMREALVRAFGDAASARADAPTTSTDTALEDLRATLPTATELSTMLGVAGVTIDVAGGPGIPGSPSFEYVELPTLIGGYMVMFRPPNGFSDTGWIELTLLADTDTADEVLTQLLTAAAPDPEMVRSTFEVTDLLDDGQGYVLDPEPGSHFTRIVGRQDALLVGVNIFHDADDDRIDQARAVVEAVLE